MSPNLAPVRIEGAMFVGSRSGGDIVGRAPGG